MSSRESIQRGLVRFKQRYWFARLLQGLLVFCGTGLVFFGVVALLEYASWLSVSQRTLLFTLTVIIEMALVFYYLGWPIAQLILNGRNLKDRSAALIIGDKLDGVGDRLLNYLELQSAPANELIDAGIEQKGKSLLGFPFYNAVSFSSLKPFLLFLIPPVVMTLYMISGNRWYMLSEGADRLIHFNTEYQRALPFVFSILSPLEIEEGTDYQLQLQLEGSVIPDQIELETKSGKQVLQRQGQNRFNAEFTSCLTDIVFRVTYDNISSEDFTVGIVKKPVIGRVSVIVEPPPYTGIADFSVDNLREIDVPQGSNVKVRFAIKNALNTYLVAEAGSVTDTLRSGEEEGYAQLKVMRNTAVVAFVQDTRLGDVRFNAIKDLVPNLIVLTDSSSEGLNISVAANDDYGIVKSSVLFISIDGTETRIELPVKGGLVDNRFFISFIEAALLREIQIRVSDYVSTVSRVLDFKKFAKQDQTNSELLDAAGEEMQLMKTQEDNSKSNSPSNKEKKKQSQTKQAEDLVKIAEQLTEKDSIQFERFRQLSEEVKDILNKMDKNLPKAQQELQEEKLEEMLKQLEQEWAILKAIEQLKKMDEAIEKDPFADKQTMEGLKEAEKNLEKLLNEEKTKKVDWKKFDDLQKANEELKKKDNQEEKEKEAGKEESKEEKQSEKNEKDSLNDEMKEDSDALKKQLSEMSDALMMEAMEKNIELLRRLELRALKASLKQEAVHNQTEASQQIENTYVAAQKEIILAATVILDSLEYVTIAEEELAVVLNSNVLLLAQQLDNLRSLQDVSYAGFVSGQRYLQYGLNDLASILYDILKSESSNLQNMMAGEGSCKNPKPGKGKKKSLSQKQKELGDKMGKKKGKGEGEGEGYPGKQGRQSLSQGELLELIKGQEEIMNEFKKAGGNKAGNSEAIDEMNKLLEDLLKNNLDKAIARNKDIEEKLIVIEKSENKKKEEDNKRKSQENKLDYDAIRNRVFMEYTKGVQTGSGVVNLPALKHYYTGKWVKAGQP